MSSTSASESTGFDNAKSVDESTQPTMSLDESVSKDSNDLAKIKLSPYTHLKFPSQTSSFFSSSETSSTLPMPPDRHQQISLPNRNGNHKPIDEDLVETPRSTYEKLWSKAKGDLKKGIILILEDYTKGNSIVQLLLHGHIGRPHIKDIQSLIKLSTHLTPQQIVDTLDSVLEKDKNKHSSLHRRLNFIYSKMQDVEEKEKKQFTLNL